MANPAPEATEEAPKSKKKLLVIGILALNVVVLGALAAFVLLGSSSEASAEAPAETKPAEAAKKAPEEAEAEEADDNTATPDLPKGPNSALGPTEAVGKFTINLADRATTRYLRVVINVEVSAQATADEVKMRNPQLRHITIAYLSSLKLGDTQGPGALDKIRRALEQRFNHVLTTGTVRQVYFTDFVTQ